MNTVRSNFDGLKKLQSAVAGVTAGRRAQVGFFANKAVRGVVGENGPNQPDPLTNPELAVIHEYGSQKANIPERSILRMPLAIFLPSDIAKQGSAVWFKTLLSSGVDGVLARLGVTAENTIQRGFATKGYGQWAPLRPRTIKRKGSSAILIDSAEMRQAVSSRVV